MWGVMPMRVFAGAVTRRWANVRRWSFARLCLALRDIYGQMKGRIALIGVAGVVKHLQPFFYADDCR